MFCSCKCFAKTVPFHLDGRDMASLVFGIRDLGPIRETGILVTDNTVSTLAHLSIISNTFLPRTVAALTTAVDQALIQSSGRGVKTQG